MSRKYEATIVIDAKGKDEGVDAIVTQITREFEKSGAKLENVDNQGSDRGFLHSCGGGSPKSAPKPPSAETVIERVQRRLLVYWLKSAE